MDVFINNFYVIRIIFLVLIVLISISTVDTMKKKYSIKLGDKLNIRSIDFNFLIRMISLSFVLRILIEQTIYFLPIEETTSNITINVFVILVEVITTCLFAPIFEEIIFRFGVYEYLHRKIKSNIVVILLTSILFSIIHFYEIDGFIIILIISLMWNYSYFKTNNLMYPIIMHLAHNIYAMVGYIEFNNIIYILFGFICLIIYILSKIKNSSKNTTAN